MKLYRKYVLKKLIEAKIVHCAFSDARQSHDNIYNIGFDLVPIFWIRLSVLDMIHEIDQ